MRVTSWLGAPECTSARAVAAARFVVGLGTLFGCDIVAPTDDEGLGITAPGVGADAQAPAAPAAGDAASPDGPDAASSSSLATTASPPPVFTAVDANGVKGAMVATGFLSDAGNGRRDLISLDWEIPANSEHTLCARITVPGDIYLSAIHPVSPLGTHHTGVLIEERSEVPDGVSVCSAAAITTAVSAVGASGIGTGARQFPEGVAMKIARGAQIQFNVHLYNTTDRPLRGRSGQQVGITTPDKVKVLADGVAMGPTRLSIPPGRSVQTGSCTVDHDYTALSVFPHMHAMGVYMKVVARRPGRGDVVIHDGPFDFQHQEIYRLEPLALTAGDKVELECTYSNTTGRTLKFGESSDDEMCIAGFSRIPAGGRTVCPY